MAVKNKTGLTAENNQLYDDAIELTQEVTATNQKTVTSDQIDSFAALLDRAVNVDVSVSPLAISLDFAATEQFILDLTAEPLTKVFEVATISNLQSGQNARILITKNADQAITISAASGGPAITRANNPLQITGIGAPTEIYYSYLNDAVADSANASVLNIYVDSVSGDDANDGLSETSAFATENKAYQLAQTAVTSEITIHRAQGGTYTLTEAFTLENKNLKFDAFGTGAVPEVRTSGATGQLTLTGSLHIVSTEISTVLATVPYFKTASLDVHLETGTLEVNAAVMFTSSGNTAPDRLTFKLGNGFLITGGGGLANITDIETRAVDVTGQPVIMNFLNNIPSTVLNVVDGMYPVFEATFQGAETPFDNNPTVDKLVEKGLDAGKWSIDNVDFSVGTFGTEGEPTDNSAGGGPVLEGLQISSDGAHCFVLDSSAPNPKISRFPLSTPFDILTKGAADQTFVMNTEFDSALSFHFTDDGLLLYVLGETPPVPTSPPTLPPANTRCIMRYSLGTAFDITTTAIIDEYKRTDSQDTNAEGIHLNPDLTRCFLMGSSQQKVFVYLLGTPGDLTTIAGFVGVIDLTGQDGNLSYMVSVHLSVDGLTMWVSGRGNRRIYEYALGAAFDYNRVFFTKSYDSSQIDTDINSIHVDEDGGRFYMLADGPDRVYQMNFNGPRTYLLTKLGSGDADEDFDYTIEGEVADENEEETVSGVSINRTNTGTVITVERGASVRKDFNVKVYRNANP